jgi:predicted lipoprotein with Yx(FWY)xxD motif
MRKSGWVAAAGLGSLVLLLTACGGSSSSSSTSANGSSTSTTSPAAQASSTALAGIQPGDTVLIVQKSKLGFVLAEANGQVVYTYSKDTKGGAPTCTGSCASTWAPVTGKPYASQADTFPGKFGTVADTDGAKQVTYNGLPLYVLKGAKALTVSGNGMDGEWHVIMMSESDVNS